MRIHLALALVAVILILHFRPATGDNPDHPSPDPPGPNSSRMVAIYAETAPSPPYTNDQFVALNSARSGDIRKWCDENLKAGGLRIFDPDEKLTDQSKFWQDAFANPPPIHPAVKVWNGRRWGKWQAVTTIDELNKAIGAK